MNWQDVKATVVDSNRILLIGADSVEPALVRRWAQDGLLPTFAKLMRDSRLLEVENPSGLVSGGTWQSFASGVGPGRHGLYDAYEFFDPETYGIGVCDEGHQRFPAFWEALSDAGKRVAVIDVPYTFLSPDLNGIQVMDWLTHTRLTNGRMATQPKSLAGEIEQRFGTDPLGTDRGSPCDRDPPRGREEFIAFRNNLVKRIQAKAAFCEELLAQENWDLFLAAFCECHCAGHHCWHTHDESHPRYDAAVTAEVGDIVRDVYVAIDRAVGWLIERAGEGTTVMVYCPFGMTAGYTGTYLLDDILLRLDGKRPSVVKQKAVDGLRQLWRGAPAQVRHLLQPLRQGPWESFYQTKVLPDRATRRFFEVKANDATGGIRFNVIGRETHGLVEPGEAYDRLCEELEEALLTFVNLDTGEPLVREVTRTDRLHSGEGLERLPDLLVQWNREQPILRVSSPATGVIENRHLSMRSGDHAQDGLFFTNHTETGVPQSNRAIAVTDLAPMVTGLLGVDMTHAARAPAEASSRPSVPAE